MTKKEKLINLINSQLNIKLTNENNVLNNKNNLLYTKIETKDKLTILTFLNKYNIKYEEHVNGFYWINCKSIEEVKK